MIRGGSGSQRRKIASTPNISEDPSGGQGPGNAKREMPATAFILIRKEEKRIWNAAKAKNQRRTYQENRPKPGEGSLGFY